MSRGAKWWGRGLTAVPVLFLLMDGAMKVLRLPPVVEAFGQLGIPISLALGIGLLELGCLALYVLPRTQLLGAVLLTGYLGGAIATHVKLQSPLFSHVLFPTYLGAMLWIGLLLRQPRLRQLVLASQPG